MSRYSMAVCAIAGYFGLAVSASAPDKAWRPDAPVIAAKGKDYLVHYLPAGFGTSDAAFLHTTLSTGEMKVLLKVRSDQFEVLGYAADRERLYVAARSQVVHLAPGSGLPHSPEVRFHVYAFWLADGSELAHKELKEEDVPEKLRTRKPVVKGGPIELIEDGSRCFGLTLKFDGKKAVAPKQPK